MCHIIFGQRLGSRNLFYYFLIVLMLQEQCTGMWENQILLCIANQKRIIRRYIEAQYIRNVDKCVEEILDALYTQHE